MAENSSGGKEHDVQHCQQQQFSKNARAGLVEVRTAEGRDRYAIEQDQQ